MLRKGKLKIVKTTFYWVLVFLWFLWPVLVALAAIAVSEPQLQTFYKRGWTAEKMFEVDYIVDWRMLAGTLLNYVWLMFAFYLCPFKIFSDEC